MPKPEPTEPNLRSLTELSSESGATSKAWERKSYTPEDIRKINEKSQEITRAEKFINDRSARKEINEITSANSDLRLTKKEKYLLTKGPVLAKALLALKGKETVIFDEGEEQVVFALVDYVLKEGREMDVLLKKVVGIKKVLDERISSIESKAPMDQEKVNFQGEWDTVKQLRNNPDIQWKKGQIQQIDKLNDIFTAVDVTRESESKTIIPVDNLKILQRYFSKEGPYYLLVQKKLEEATAPKSAASEPSPAPDSQLNLPAQAGREEAPPIPDPAAPPEKEISPAPVVDVPTSDPKSRRQETPPATAGKRRESWDPVEIQRLKDTEHDIHQLLSFFDHLPLRYRLKENDRALLIRGLDVIDEMAKLTRGEAEKINHNDELFWELFVTGAPNEPLGPLMKKKWEEKENLEKEGKEVLERLPEMKIDEAEVKDVLGKIAVTLGRMDLYREDADFLKHARFIFYDLDKYLSNSNEKNPLILQTHLDFWNEYKEKGERFDILRTPAPREEHPTLQVMENRNDEKERLMEWLKKYSNEDLVEIKRILVKGMADAIMKEESMDPDVVEKVKGVMRTLDNIVYNSLTPTLEELRDLNYMVSDKGLGINRRLKYARNKAEEKSIIKILSPIIPEQAKRRENKPWTVEEIADTRSQLESIREKHSPKIQAFIQEALEALKNQEERLIDDTIPPEKKHARFFSQFIQRGNLFEEINNLQTIETRRETGIEAATAAPVEEKPVEAPIPAPMPEAPVAEAVPPPLPPAPERPNVISDTERQMIEKKMESLGIRNGNELMNIEGFREIENDAAKQIFILNNLQQLKYEKMMEELEKKKGQYVKKGGFFSRIGKRGAVKFKTKEYAKEVATQPFNLKNYEDDIKKLLRASLMGPPLKVKEDGTLTAEYVTGISEKRKYDAEQFNEIANRYAALPIEEKKYLLNRNDRKEYEKIKKQYFLEKDRFANSMHEDGDKTAMTFVNRVNLLVHLHKRAIQHPEVEKELSEFGSRSGMKSLWNEVNNSGQKGTLGMTFLGGMGLRGAQFGAAWGRRFMDNSALANFAVSGAVPVVGMILGGVFGGVRGWFSGQQSLEKKAQNIVEGKIEYQRKRLGEGESRWSSDLNYRKLNETRTGNIYDKDVKGKIIGTREMKTGLIDKLQEVRERLEASVAKRDELMTNNKPTEKLDTEIRNTEDLLRSRLFYVHKKLMDNSIIFGSSSTALGNKLALIEAVSSAEVALTINEGRVQYGTKEHTRIGRLERRMEREMGHIKTKQILEKSEAALKGTLIGAGGALVGYGVASHLGDFSHHQLENIRKFFGWKAENIDQNLMGGIKETATAIRNEMLIDNMTNPDVSPSASPSSSPAAEAATPASAAPEVAAATSAENAPVPEIPPKPEGTKIRYVATKDSDSYERFTKYFDKDVHGLEETPAGRTAWKTINDPNTVLGEERNLRYKPLDREKSFKPLHKGDVVEITEHPGGHKTYNTIPKAQADEYLAKNPPGRVYSNAPSSPEPVAPKVEASAPILNNENWKNTNEGNYLLQKIKENPKAYGYPYNINNKPAVDSWARDTVPEILKDNLNFLKQIQQAGADPAHSIMDIHRSEGKWSASIIHSTAEASPTPVASPSASPFEAVAPIESPSPTATIAAEVTPTVTPTPTSTPTPTATPTPSPTPEATPSPTSTPSPSETPTPTASPEAFHPNKPPEFLADMSQETHFSYPTVEHLANYTAENSTDSYDALEEIFSTDQFFQEFSGDQKRLFLYRLFKPLLDNPEEKMFKMAGNHNGSIWNLPAGSHMDYTEVLNKDVIKKAMENLNSSGEELSNANYFHDFKDGILQKMKNMDVGNIGPSTLDEIIKEMKKPH